MKALTAASSPPTNQRHFIPSPWVFPLECLYSPRLMFVAPPLVFSTLLPVSCLSVSLVISGYISMCIHSFIICFEVPLFPRNRYPDVITMLAEKLVAIPCNSSTSSTSEGHPPELLLPDCNASQNDLRFHSGAERSSFAAESLSITYTRPCLLYILLQLLATCRISDRR